MDDLHIKNGVTIPAHELHISASRAGGPGGQHVNKTSTRISIRWHPGNSVALNETQKEHLLQKLAHELTSDGEIIVHNGSTRSQAQNKKLALSQLTKKVRRALHVPKKRMKTRVPKKVKESRLKAKKVRSELKQSRSKKHF